MKMRIKMRKNRLFFYFCHRNMKDINRRRKIWECTYYYNMHKEINSSDCERLNFSKQNHQRHHDIWNRSAYEFFEQERKKLFQLRN